MQNSPDYLSHLVTNRDMHCYKNVSNHWSDQEDEPNFAFMSIDVKPKCLYYGMDVHVNMEGLVATMVVMAGSWWS